MGRNVNWGETSCTHCQNCLSSHENVQNSICNFICLSIVMYVLQFDVDKFLNLGESSIFVVHFALSSKAFLKKGRASRLSSTLPEKFVVREPTASVTYRVVFGSEKSTK